MRRLSMLTSLILLVCVEGSLNQSEAISDACKADLSAAYAFGGSKCIIANRLKRAACMCPDTEYQETVVSCIDQLIYSEKEEDSVRISAYESFSRACNTTMEQIESLHRSSATLKPYPAPRSLKQFGNWTVQGSFKPTLQECHDALVAYRNHAMFTLRSYESAGFCLAYWGFVLLLRVLSFWFGFLFAQAKQSISNSTAGRTWRRLVTVPALFKRRHSSTIYLTRFFTLNLPTRQDSLIILGFLFMHVSFIFAWNPIHNPSYIYDLNYRTLWGKYVGYRASTIACMELPLLFLFAGRNNFMQWLTGWSHDTFVVFHKWIARAIVFAILIHAAAYTVNRVQQDMYNGAWSQPYWRCGVAAAVCMGLLLFQAMHAIRRLNYELFLLLHICLAAGMLASAYKHTHLHENEVRWFYACFAVWGFDRLMRIVRIIVSGPLSEADIVAHGDSMLEYSISYSRMWKPRPGDYVFVHIVQPFFFWESHPFTISLGCVDDEQSELKVFSRVKDGMTRRTLSKALNKGGRFKTKVWIDGPYGPSYNLFAFEEVLLLAGGIGITAPFSYVQGIIESRDTSIRSVQLAWATSGGDSLKWFKHQLNYIREKGCVNVRIYKGGKTNVDPVLEEEKQERGDIECVLPRDSRNSNSASFNAENKDGRPESAASSETDSDEASFIVDRAPLNAQRVVRDAILSAKGSLAILCCGPPGMNDDARKAVAENLTAAPHYVEYFEESFSW